MSEALQDPVLPPEQTLDSELAHRLSELCHRSHSEGGARLVLGDDESVEVPDELVEVLRRVVEAMAANRAVSIVPVNLNLTSQQAADLLGVQRSFVVKMLDADEIPSHKPGRHRLVRLKDLLAYREHSIEQCRESLSRLVEIGEEAAMYEGTAAPVTTR